MADKPRRIVTRTAGAGRANGKPPPPTKVIRSGKAKHDSGLTVRKADLSRSRKYRWAWGQRLLLGYPNLVVGKEGVGKGTLAAWQAAQITLGKLDGDLRGTPRKVVFIGDEDSWDNIWVPRLSVAGADLDKVEYIESGSGGRVLDVKKDAAALEAYAKAENVALAYFDQLLDNLGRVNNWRESEVRDALAPLRKVAREADLAVVMSLHPNKRGGSFRDQLSGTPAFNALSRSSLLVAAHPEEPGRIVVVRAKGNYSIEPPAFEFRIEEQEVMGAELITTSRITDIRETGLKADDVLDAASSRRQENSRAGRARALLSEILHDDLARPAAEIIEQMEAHGFTKRQAQDARVALKIDTWKDDQFQGGWMWGPEPVERITVSDKLEGM
jgi:hypothetical protein